MLVKGSTGGKPYHLICWRYYEFAELDGLWTAFHQFTSLPSMRLEYDRPTYGYCHGNKNNALIRSPVYYPGRKLKATYFVTGSTAFEKASPLCIGELGNKSFRLWLVAKSSHSHYLNQYCLIAIWSTNMNWQRWIKLKFCFRNMHLKLS